MPYRFAEQSPLQYLIRFFSFSLGNCIIVQSNIVLVPNRYIFNQQRKRKASLCLDDLEKIGFLSIL